MAKQHNKRKTAGAAGLGGPAKTTLFAGGKEPGLRAAIAAQYPKRSMTEVIRSVAKEVNRSSISP
jgi:hypothetical protein